MLKVLNPFSKRDMIRFITLFIFAAFSVFTHSHELSNGYLTLKNDSNNTLSGELLLKPEDIGQAAGLDSNNDGNLTWGEVNRNHTMANDYIQNHLVIEIAKRDVRLVLLPLLYEIYLQSYYWYTHCR
jgi:hypothetical protein